MQLQDRIKEHSKEVRRLTKRLADDLPQETKKLMRTQVKHLTSAVKVLKGKVEKLKKATVK